LLRRSTSPAVPPRRDRRGPVAIASGALLHTTARACARRLPAVTPAVGIDEARGLAAAGVQRYSRIEGRLDADDEFPDENERPLVFRRRRLETRRGRGWRILAARLERAPSRVGPGLEAIDVDVDALDVGLVTLVRESAGTAAEAGAALDPGIGAGLAAGAVVRLRIEQLSSVEHATVLGVPVATPDGRVAMTAGTGRPLVVCTLERDEAMRVLAEGGRARPLAAAAALGGGLLGLAIGMAGLLLGGLLVAGARGSSGPGCALACSCRRRARPRRRSDGVARRRRRAHEPGGAGSRRRSALRPPRRGRRRASGRGHHAGRGAPDRPPVGRSPGRQPPAHRTQDLLPIGKNCEVEEIPLGNLTNPPFLGARASRRRGPGNRARRG
jgi:hypothetical protein